MTREDCDEFANVACRILMDDAYYLRLRANAKIKAEQMSSQNMALKLEQVYMQMLDVDYHQSRNLKKVNTWIGS